ncbi:hypothetical protein C8J57DRAFT_177847 [Mycena rebaudengoi]|nr:hypothetical protein C8J57DRAFT_177847 [Mycena rebaudengoi]
MLFALPTRKQISYTLRLLRLTFSFRAPFITPGISQSLRQKIPVLGITASLSQIGSSSSIPSFLSSFDPPRLLQLYRRRRTRYTLEPRDRLEGVVAGYNRLRHICLSCERRSSTHISHDRLSQDDLHQAVSNAIAYGFQTVNITQLRSLDLRMTRMIPFLERSGDTIQKLRLYHPPFEPLSYDLLEGNTNLHSLDIVQSSTGIVCSLCIGGNLHHLKALKTISLCIPELESILDVEWPEIDVILAQASDSLAEVHLRTDASTIELYFDLARCLLPSVATKIGLGDDSS